MTKFTAWMVRHPWLWLAGCWAVVLLLLGIFLSGTLNTGDGASDSPGQLLAIEEVEVKRFLALLELEDEDEAEELPVQAQSFTQLFLVYSADNVFDVDIIKSIYRTEQAAQDIDSYRGRIVGYEDHCLKSYSLANASSTELVSNGCLPPFSPVNNVVFANRPNFTAADVASLTQEDVDEAVRLFSTEDALAEGTDFFFAKDFFDAEGNRTFTSKTTRSIIYFGLPLAGVDDDGNRLYRNKDHRDTDQQNIFDDFVLQYEDLFDDTPDPVGLTVTYYEDSLGSQQIARLVQGDFLLAGGAGVLVVILLAIQLRSWLLAIAGVIQIVLAYPLSLVVYHGVFGIEINTQLNLLVLFVVMGIGADDLYVFADAWAQSASAPASEVGTTLETRMRWVWRRAAHAMGSTTITTFLAFVITALSPIPAIAVFGILAALMCAWVYALTIFMFPAVVVLYHKRLERMKFCCFLKPSAAVIASAEGQSAGKAEGQTDDVGSVPTSAAVKPEVAANNPNGDVANLESYRVLERYFYRHAGVVHRFRWGIVAVAVLVFIGSVVGATQLKVPEQEETGLPDGSEVKRFFDAVDLFPPNNQDGNSQVHMVWGLNSDDPIDRGSLDRNDEEDFGELIPISNPAKFQPHTLAAQQYLSNVCSSVATRISENGERFVNRGGAACFVDDFWAHEQAESGRTPADATPGEFLQRVRDFVYFVDADGNTPNTIYEADLGGVTVSTATEVTFVRVKFNTTMPVGRDITLSLREYWFDQWAALMVEINAGAPTELQDGFQTEGFGLFAFHVTSEQLVRATFQAASVSFLVAAACVLIVTHNIWVTLIVALVLLAVVAAILALLVAIGSDLGVVESIICSILVGLAVDFALHVTVAYNADRTSSTTFGRARTALFEMGISIFGGFITTMAASLCLLAAQLTFFVVFGKVLCLLFTASLLWAVVGLPALLMVMGPKKHPTGDLVVAAKRCLRRDEPSEAGDKSNPAPVTV